MRPAEIRNLLRPRLPEGDRIQRALARCVTIEDLQRLALRNWPRGVRDYVEGGADDEEALRGNREAFQRHRFVPACLRDVSKVHTDTRVLGFDAALPFALAPTGY